MNHNQRFPAHGLPPQGIELSRSYPFRAPMMNGVTNPPVHFIPFHGIPTPPTHAQFQPPISSVGVTNLTIPHAFMNAPAPIDLRNQKIPPHGAPAPVPTTSDQPLDLSRKQSSAEPAGISKLVYQVWIYCLAVVSYHDVLIPQWLIFICVQLLLYQDSFATSGDQPLDLSKPCKATTDSNRKVPLPLKYGAAVLPHNYVSASRERSNVMANSSGTNNITLCKIDYVF